jgi:DNA gyrase subunit B
LEKSVETEKDTYKALNSIDAIRIRPGMYVGDTVNPNQLVTEILDNSLDEIGNNYANQLQLNIDVNNNHCWIVDNGRGLKVYDMKDSNGVLKDSIELLCTDTHTGSKFDNDDYGVLIGMHGVGLVVVNALSNWLVVKTRDRENKHIVYEYQFINATESVTKRQYEDHEDINSWSTIVGFQPNSQYFESDKFVVEELAKRLLLAQAKFNECDFYFNNKKLTKRTFHEYIKLLFKCETDFKKLSYEIAPNQKIEIYLNYVESQYTNILGDVNLRHCEGTYLTSFQTLLKNKVSEKLGKIVENVNPNYLLNGLNCYISLVVPEPKYDSQSKVRMTLNVKDLINPLHDQVDWFLDNDTLAIIQKNLEKTLKKKLAISLNKSVNISAKNKLRDCLKTPGEILYIVEGESALGPLKQIRDINTEAIYPLRGKVLNVEKATIDKISNNKEITDLIEACGPKNNRRYKKIKLLMDADIDGYHISVLILLVVQKFLKDYIQSGNLSIIMPPLYGVNIKGNHLAVYDQKDLAQYQNKYEITRFKGLGEMNPIQLEAAIRSNVEYVVQYPDTKESLETIINVITNSDLKKQMLRRPEFNLKTLLSKVLNSKQP